MPTTIIYNETKFSELVLYIAEKMKEDKSYGATVLNKVLFYADFFHYAEHGAPISGAQYNRLPHGPAPRRLLPVRERLVNEGRAVIRTKQVGARNQHRLESLEEANLSLFTGAEIETVNEVIDMVRNHTAVSISDVSHEMSGWKLAKDNEEIPYSSIFLYRGPVTDEDKSRARELSDQLHLVAA